MPRPVHRFGLYALINVLFALLVGAAAAVSAYPDRRLLHLILLFALCSTPIIDLDGINGRHALLALFMFVYFVSYGVGDISNLLAGTDAPGYASLLPDSGLLSKTEGVILVGGIMLVLGYRLAVFMASANRPIRAPRDWPKSTILIVGTLLWGIGTIATFRWDVYIVTDITYEAIHKGMESLTPIVTDLYLIAQSCQPPGILILAYAVNVFRNPLLLAFFIVVVVVQIFIGFVVDIKGLAMLGMILAIITAVLVNGRIPKGWLVVGVCFVTLIFPYFQAYRNVIHGGGISRTAVVENFAKALEMTADAKDKINSGRERAQTFLERSSVKGSVEVIVENTGNGVAFQSGHTLAPILETFIPRILWSAKTGVPTGQLFNHQFHLTDNDDISISPSHLGELYWNYGWAGVVFGMAVIGLICGWVGVRFNLADYRSVTRLLVTAITAKFLIVGFEGAIDDNYVVWLRSIVGIGILHLVLARVPVASGSRPTNSRPSEASADRLRVGVDNQPRGERLYPNLLA